MAENGKGKRQVSEVMSAPVVTAAPGDSVAEAAKLMQEKNVGSVVVCDGDKPVGILTERDIVEFTGSKETAADTTVSQLMTEAPQTVSPDADMETTLQKLAKSGYRHMPVVSGEGLVGIVSMRDLMRVAHVTSVETHELDVPKGLDGVAVAETEIGDVRGKEGFYHYRQYSAVELCEKRHLEDAWFLLFEGHLPSKKERQEFKEKVAPMRVIADEVKELLPSIATLGEHFRPLDALRSAYSVQASSLDLHPWLDMEP
ncbi:hypothetical protein BH18ACT15_BH18ACT15_07810 [soil metagenome]